MQGGAEARYIRDNILIIQSQVTFAQPYSEGVVGGAVG